MATKKSRNAGDEELTPEEAELLQDFEKLLDADDASVKEGVDESVDDRPMMPPPSVIQANIAPETHPHLFDEFGNIR
jgi:hypothetical protein